MALLDDSSASLVLPGVFCIFALIFCLDLLFSLLTLRRRLALASKECGAWLLAVSELILPVVCELVFLYALYQIHDLWALKLLLIVVLAGIPTLIWRAALRELLSTQSESEPAFSGEVFIYGFIATFSGMWFATHFASMLFAVLGSVELHWLISLPIVIVYWLLCLIISGGAVHTFLYSNRNADLMHLKKEMGLCGAIKE